MIEPRAILDGARAVGVELTEAQAGDLARFAVLLERWNKTFNLVSKADLPRLLPRHLLDSLSLAPLLEGSRVLDVGTGAGLPGVPLAIARPEKCFVLLDRSDRKLRFVRQVLIELGLRHVEVCVAPAESYRPARPFDTVVARAVTAAVPLWTIASRLLAPAGVVLLQSGDPERLELPANAEIERHRVDIPGLDAPHWILALRPSAVQRACP